MLFYLKSEIDLSLFTSIWRLVAFVNLKIKEKNVLDWKFQDGNILDWNIPDWNIPDWNIPDWNVPDWNIWDWNILDWNIWDWNITLVAGEKRILNAEGPEGAEGCGGSHFSVHFENFLNSE